VYQDLGKHVVGCAFEGYNACLFAYGQTGSGKSYSMMGQVGGKNEGLIPRICRVCSHLKISYLTRHLKKNDKKQNLRFYNDMSYKSTIILQCISKNIKS
jgi:hypothetical protein